MAKNSVRQYDVTAANNTDIGGISLVEGVTMPSSVNNIERTSMANQAQWLAEMSYPTVGGSADVLTLTPTTALAALADNVVYTGTIGASPNATTTPTLAVSATGAKVIRKMSGGVDIALVANDLLALTQYTFVYKTAANSGGGAWIVLAPSSTTTYAPLASPVFTGNPTAPTASSGDNDTSIATTAFVTDAVKKRVESLVIAIGDETTALTTGTAKMTFRNPYASVFNVTAVKSSVSTASSSGLPTVDIKEGGVSIFSTLLTIDANEKTSTTAATAAVVSDASLAADAEMTIDVTVAGTGTKGLKVYILGYPS